MAVVRRGEVPADPELAAGAARWARAYLAQRNLRAMRIWTGLALVVFPAATVFFILRGDSLPAIATGVTALLHLVQATLTPVFRLRNVQRSLEGCERIVSGELGTPPST